MSGEAASRARIDLPGRQAALADAVLATGRPVVVLLFSGRPLAMPEVFDRAAAVVACWFPGSEAGHAVAAPADRRRPPRRPASPVTWPRDVGQVPIAYSARPGGRPENPADKYTSKYLDLPNTPQFPFGHGLELHPLHPDRPDGQPAPRPSPSRPPSPTPAPAPAPPPSSSSSATRSPASPARRSSSARFAARRRSPRARRRRSASPSTADDFAFLGADLRPVVEPGAFEVHVGFSADPAGLPQRPLHAAAEPAPGSLTPARPRCLPGARS